MHYLHIYNRGAHKAPIFKEKSDYRRFLQLLYVGNSTKPFLVRDVEDIDVFATDRKQQLVDILAYCLMPNHFHIVLNELLLGGATKFIRKICTGYSMYYNLKYKHSGTVFQGKFKTKDICDERYLETALNYVHLNPYKLDQPDDLSGDVKLSPKHTEKAVKCSKKYEFSSFQDYLGAQRPQGAILYRGPTSVTAPPLDRV